MGGRKWIEKKGFERIIKFFPLFESKNEKKEKKIRKISLPSMSWKTLGGKEKKTCSFK